MTRPWLRLSAPWLPWLGALLLLARLARRLARAAGLFRGVAGGLLVRLGIAPVR